MKIKHLFPFILLLLLFSNFRGYAQQVYCNGPWGGAGAIGDPARWTFINQTSNAADANGKGAVSYGYSYFDRFVRISDWLVFLNDVDPGGSGDYSGLLGDNGMQMITYNGSQWVANAWSCAATGQSLTAAQAGKVAVSYVSFNLACRFANWVATGSVSSGAYTFASSAANADVTSINYAFAGVRLPTENEFYKAAYYNPTTSTYNTYGATDLTAGVPTQTNVNSDGTFVSQTGSPYALSTVGLYGGPPGSGTHCLWQIQAGQGSRSAYGLFNMVGGFHHLLTIDQGGTVDATAGLMMFRPGNQYEGASGQSSAWSYPGSASDGGWTMSAHLASPSFHLVITGNECGGCPVLADPVVANGSRCGTGTVPLTITTGCTTAGSSLHIYSDAGITNDVTSQFTVSGSTLTSPSISSTTTYYAVCQSTTIATTCFSNSDTFTATVTAPPTATAAATNATCNVATGVANSDAKITLTFTSGQRYQYTSGVTFTGTATPAAITLIPAGGVIASALPNAAQSYTVRIYDATDNTCYVDRVVSTTVTNCSCPTVAAPAVGDASRCGTGTVTATIATACASGTTLKIFSNSTLATDVTSQFTISGSSITSPSITSGSTPTYYAACQLNSNTSCISTGNPFTVTSTAPPTATAAATNATCNVSVANSDATITLTFTTGQRYQYTSGATFSGTATPAAITTIPANGVIASTLPNAAQSYTVRIYDATDNTCYVDRVVSTTVTNCSCPTVTAPAVGDASRCGTGTLSATIATACASGTTLKIFSNSTLTTDVTSQFTVSGTTITTPSITSGTAPTYYAACQLNASPACISSGDAFILTATATPTATAAVTQPTCSGANSPNNGGITINSFTSGQRYQYSVGATFASGSATPASIATIPAGGVITSGLSNVTQQYTVRIYDAALDNCYIDRVVSVTSVVCCTTPSAGADVAMCLPKTTLNLVDATAGTQWVVGSGNPATATINATTGVVTGLTVAGTYTFTLQTIGDPTCKDDIQVVVSSGDAPVVLCDNGTTSYTLTAASGLTNVKWYNMAGDEVGTGSTLTVSSNTLGLSDGTEAYYYIGESLTLTGCDVELCCPVKFLTQSCCPTPNCATVTVIKN